MAIPSHTVNQTTRNPKGGAVGSPSRFSCGNGNGEYCGWCAQQYGGCAAPGTGNGIPDEANCGCDAECIFWGDCCSDFCDECSEASPWPQGCSDTGMDALEGSTCADNDNDGLCDCIEDYCGAYDPPVETTDCRWYFTEELCNEVGNGCVYEGPGGQGCYCSNPSMGCEDNATGQFQCDFWDPVMCTSNYNVDLFGCEVIGIDCVCTDPCSGCGDCDDATPTWLEPPDPLLYENTRLPMGIDQPQCEDYNFNSGVCNYFSQIGCVWTGTDCVCSGECTEPMHWGTDQYNYDNYCCADTMTLNTGGQITIEPVHKWSVYTPGGRITCDMFNPTNGYMPAWGCGANPASAETDWSPGPGYAAGNDCCDNFGNWDGTMSLAAKHACVWCGGGYPYQENNNDELLPRCSSIDKVCCLTNTVQPDGTGQDQVLGCKTEHNCTFTGHPDYTGTIIEEEIDEPSACSDWFNLPTCDCGSPAHGCPEGYICDQGGGTWPGCDTEYYIEHGQGEGQCWCPGVSPNCKVTGSGYSTPTGICVPVNELDYATPCVSGEGTDGCTDPNANNYNPDAIFNDGTCTYDGCTDPEANNYNPDATVDDGSCNYAETCSNPGACNYDGQSPGTDGACLEESCGCEFETYCCDGNSPPTCPNGKTEHAPGAFKTFSCDENVPGSALCNSCPWDQQGSGWLALKYCNFDSRCEEPLLDINGNQVGSFDRCQFADFDSVCEPCPELEGCWVTGGTCNQRQDCNGTSYDECPDDRTCVETCCQVQQECAFGGPTCDGCCPCGPFDPGDGQCGQIYDMSGECTQDYCQEGGCCPAPCNLTCEKPVEAEYEPYWPNNMDAYCDVNNPPEDRPRICLTPSDWLDGSNSSYDFDKGDMDYMYNTNTGAFAVPANIAWDSNQCVCGVDTQSTPGYNSGVNGPYSCKWANNQGTPTGNYQGSSSDSFWGVCVEDGQGENGGARCRNDFMDCSLSTGSGTCGDVSMEKTFSIPWDDVRWNNCHCDPCDEWGMNEYPVIRWSGGNYYWNDGGYCKGWLKGTNGQSGFTHCEEGGNNPDCSGGAGNCGYDFFSTCGSCEDNDYGCNTDGWMCGHWVYATLSRTVDGGCGSGNCDTWSGPRHCWEDYLFGFDSAGCYFECDNYWDDCDSINDWDAEVGWIANGGVNGSCNQNSNTGQLTLENYAGNYGWGCGNANSQADRDHMCIYISDSNHNSSKKCLTLANSQNYGTVTYTWSGLTTDNPWITISNYNNVYSCPSSWCNENAMSLAAGGSHKEKVVYAKQIALQPNEKTKKLEPSSGDIPKTDMERQKYRDKMIKRAHKSDNEERRDRKMSKMSPKNKRPARGRRSKRHGRRG